MKASFVLVALLAVNAQAQVIMDENGRNIGYSQQYGNYTQYVDKNGNKGYSYTDGTTTTYTNRDGRSANPAQVVPRGAAPVAPVQGYSYGSPAPQTGRYSY